MSDPTAGTPRTEAGRRVLANAKAGTTIWPAELALDILAIEAEASGTGLDAAWARAAKAWASSTTGSPYMSVHCDLFGWCVVTLSDATRSESEETESPLAKHVAAALNALAARLTPPSETEP